jgi:hypothetical protein
MNDHVRESIGAQIPFYDILASLQMFLAQIA